MPEYGVRRASKSVGLGIRLLFGHLNPESYAGASHTTMLASRWMWTCFQESSAECILRPFSLDPRAIVDVWESSGEHQAFSKAKVEQRAVHENVYCARLATYHACCFNRASPNMRNPSGYKSAEQKCGHPALFHHAVSFLCQALGLKTTSTRLKSTDARKNHAGKIAPWQNMPTGSHLIKRSKRQCPPPGQRSVDRRHESSTRTPDQMLAPAAFCPAWGPLIA